jgi:hypothetical protein
MKRNPPQKKSSKKFPSLPSEKKKMMMMKKKKKMVLDSGKLFAFSKIQRSHHHTWDQPALDFE